MTDKKESGQKADAKKPAEPTDKKSAEADKDAKSKDDPNLAVVEKFGEPDYAGIAPSGEFNLYKVSMNIF